MATQTRNDIPPRPDTAGLEPDDLLTREEVAGYFRMRPRTIREWTDDGLLPRRKVRGRVLYRWSDILALAEGGE